jgi:curved DNA-binding protein CbpA
MTAPIATYYDILRVGRRARPENVRTAYRKLAQKYHPDKMPGNAGAERVMAALNEAYAVLSDPERRAIYDQRIGQSRAAARRDQQLILASLDHPGAAWPWYLLFATIAFSAAAVGISVYKGYVPGASVATPTAAPAAQPARNPIKFIRT